MSGSGQPSSTLTPLLRDIAKKDDDMRVVDDSGATIVIETTLDLEEEGVGVPLEPPSALDEDLVERAAGARPANVEVRIVFTVYTANAVLCFSALLLGYVPYWLLAYDEKAHVARAALGAAGGLFVLLYIAMLSVHRTHSRTAAALAMAWGASVVLFVGALAAVVRNLGPLQTAAAVWAQSVAMVVYTRLSPRYLSPTRAFIIMGVAGGAVWALGWIAFAAQRDWLTAAISALFIAGSAAWGAFQVARADRYDVSEADRTRAVIRFYGDPVLLFGDKLCKRSSASEIKEEEENSLLE